MSEQNERRGGAAFPLQATAAAARASDVTIFPFLPADYTRREAETAGLAKVREEES
jgi:hypothetical protein